MRAIVIATGAYSDMLPLLAERYTAPMLPLLDRPFLQHVAEYLIGLGIVEVDFVLSHLPEKIESFFEDGTRWGGRFRFHLARDASRPYGALRVLCDGDQHILLGHADQLPQLALRQHSKEQTPVMFCRKNEEKKEVLPQWTGWAQVMGALLDGLQADWCRKEVADYFFKHAEKQGVIEEVQHVLQVYPYNELIAAHRQVLSDQFTGLLWNGREVEKGIWLSRNVSLHPTALLNAPVYIGENCRIGAGVHLGPNAVVGKNCILDSDCKVEDALVFPDSYIGKGLELVDAIAAQETIINTRLETAIVVKEDFIVGDIASNTAGKWWSRKAVCIMAWAFLGLSWPLLLMTAVLLKLGRKGPVLHKSHVLRLPAPSEEEKWRTFALWSFIDSKERPTSRLADFLLCFLPALVNVARGEMRFVGVPPRSIEEVRALWSDWRALYLGSKVGIVDEALIQGGETLSKEERYSAEAFYAVSSGWSYDFKLMVRYFTEKREHT